MPNPGSVPAAQFSPSILSSGPKNRISISYISLTLSYTSYLKLLILNAINTNYNYIKLISWHGFVLTYLIWVS